MNLRGLDSKSAVDVKERTGQYAKLASWMNADADEIGKLFYFIAKREEEDTPFPVITLSDICILQHSDPPQQVFYGIWPLLSSQISMQTRRSSCLCFVTRLA